MVRGLSAAGILARQRAVVPSHTRQVQRGMALRHPLIPKSTGIPVVLIALSALFAAPPALAQPVITCDSDSSLFNTAYDGAGGRLPVGQTDANWEVGQGTFDGGPASVETWIPAWVVGQAVGAWTPSPFGNADWIDFYPDGRQGAANVDHYFRYQFELDPSVDPATFGIGIDFYTDNSVQEVYINGAPQSTVLPPGTIPQNPDDPYFYGGFAQGNQASLLLTSGWQTGANELVIHVSSGPGWVGLLAQITATGLCPPQSALDCGGDTPITISGNAQAWTPDSTWQTVSGNSPVLAINAPEGQGVQLFSAQSNILTLDMSTLVPEGEVVTLHVGEPAGFEGEVIVESSVDGVTFGGAVTSTVGAVLPAIVAERAMWWPGPTAGHWTEASATLGSTAAGASWAIAEARVGTDGRTEADDPALPSESFVLIANASATAGQVRVRLITDDGTTLERIVEVAGHARRTLALGVEWPELSGQRASVVVESLDPTVPITVEHACYSSIPGRVWIAGAAARATPLQ
ncbi:MAG: hypothetical protein GEV06_07045 [Luteitalea sp.]|nr:hypothetical protein [Luteitalea sp.]